MPSEIPHTLGSPQKNTGVGTIAAHKPFAMALFDEGIQLAKCGDLEIEAAHGKISARKLALHGPGRALLADRVADLLQRMFAEAPICRQLAAEDVEERRAGRCLDLQHVIARGFLRLRGAIVEQRPNGGIGPDDILARDRFGEILARSRAEIVALLLADRDVLRIALVVTVGRADQRELSLIGNGEDDALVRVLEEIGPGIVELLANDDVTALHQPDMTCLVATDGCAQHPVDPRPRRIDEHAGTVNRSLAGEAVLQRDFPDPVHNPRGGDLMARKDQRTACLGIGRVEHDETRIIDPAIGIFERLGENRLQWPAGRILPEIEHLGGRQKLPAAQVIVEEQPEPDHPGRADAALLVWQYEPQRPDHVRRSRPQHFPLLQRLAHQPEFVMFEIAQAAMDELRRAGRGAGGKIVHLRKRDRIPTANRVTRDAAAIDAAADNENIESASLAHPPSPTSQCALQQQRCVKRSKAKRKRKSNESLSISSSTLHRLLKMPFQ